MATLALPAPPALPVFEPALDFQLTRDPEPSASALSTCLLLNHRSPAPQDPVVLATYKVNLLLQGSSLILRNYTLSELVSPRPYSYLKFTDGLGNDLSDEMYLGRCSADLQISTHLFQQALSLANLAAAMFPVHHQVLPLRGLNATFIFRNYPTGAETAEDTHHVTLFPRGAHALLMEQADSAALSNRILALQFKHGLRPVGDTIPIGRCL